MKRENINTQGITAMPPVYKTLFYFCCSFTALAGIFFTFVLLLSTGFIEDEIFSVICSAPDTSFLTLFKTCYMADVHPPLYMWMLYAFRHIADFTTEIWPRLPSILFWALNAFVAWKFFPKKLGVMAKSIFVSMTLSSAFCAIYMASARSYSMILFFSTCILFCSLDILYALREGSALTTKQLVLFFAFGFLACFTHYYGAVLFVISAVLLIAFAFFKKGDWQKLIIGLCLALAVFAIWLIPSYLAIQKLNVFDGSWWNNRIPVWLAYDDFLNISFGRGSAWAAGLMLVFGLLVSAKNKKDIKAEVIFPAALILLVFTAMTILTFAINIMQGRYFIVLLPAVYLLFSVSAATLFEALPRSILLWLFFTVLLFKINVAFVGNHYKKQWDAKPFAADYLSNYKGNDILLASYYPYQPQIAEQIYGYYLEKVYKTPVKINFVNNKKAAEAQAMLKMPDTIVYLAGCDSETEDKLNSFLTLTKISQNNNANYCIFKSKE